MNALLKLENEAEHVIYIDIEHMERALASETINVPEGLSPEELESFILRHAD